jgi:plasmid maintenance system antidote protein VapI
MARTPIHPGKHLVEEIGELGISAAELARRKARVKAVREPE